MERELTKAGIGFHKNDNAFLAVDDVAALQAAADRLSPQMPPRIDALVLTLTYDVETRLIEAQNPTFGASDGSRDHKDIEFHRAFP